MSSQFFQRPKEDLSIPGVYYFILYQQCDNVIFFFLYINYFLLFSPTTTPVTEIKPRPRTSLPGKSVEESVNEHCKPPQSRSGWGSRPLSAGPFHRPNLPDIDTRRILTDCQLPPEDPAVPLIASIKKELDKFSPR